MAYYMKSKIMLTTLLLIWLELFLLGCSPETNTTLTDATTLYPSSPTPIPTSNLPNALTPTTAIDATPIVNSPMPTPSSTNDASPPSVIPIPTSTPTRVTGTNKGPFSNFRQLTDFGTFITDLTVTGNYLFGIDQNTQTIFIANITQPLWPEITTQLNFSGFDENPRYAVIDHWLFVFHWARPGQVGLHLFSVEHLENPQLVRELTFEELMGKQVGNIFQVDSSIYLVMRGSNNLYLLDLNNYSLTLVNVQLDTNNYSESYIAPLAIYPEDHSYVFASNSLTEPFRSSLQRLVLFEMRSPIEWSATEIYELSGNLTSFDLYENFAYVTWGEDRSGDELNPDIDGEILVIAINILEEWQPLTQIPLDQAIYATALADHFLYIITASTFEAFQIGVNGELIPLGMIQIPQAQWITGSITITGNFIYFSNGKGEFYVMESNWN